MKYVALSVGFVNFSHQDFVRGADGNGILEEFQSNLISLVESFSKLNKSGVVAACCFSCFKGQLISKELFGVTPSHEKKLRISN